jgi:uncharacterized protein
MRMVVVWDPTKARANVLKHGVSFSDALGVLFGTDYRGRVVIVVHTLGESVSRIISARRATRRERSQYEEGV